jgi:hypothetical protein
MARRSFYTLLAALLLLFFSVAVALAATHPASHATPQRGHAVKTTRRARHAARTVRAGKQAKAAKTPSTPQPDLPPAANIRLGFADDAAMLAFPQSAQVAANAGFSYARMYIGWADTAPTQPANPRDPNDPAYNWARSDAQMATYQAAGLEVMGAFWRVPAWANGGQDAQYLPQTFKAFADFVYAASKRYPQIHWWLPWNEPNHPASAVPQDVHTPTRRCTAPRTRRCTRPTRPTSRCWLAADDARAGPRPGRVGADAGC